LFGAKAAETMIIATILRLIRALRADMIEVKSTIRKRYPDLRSDWAW
jgi:hypothetical protein